MRVLDLFSGIGGFSLGLHRAGMETVAFCEIEPFPQAVLRKNFPGVPIYDDVRTITAERLAADGIGGVDLICGGFPCQPFSVAGQQRGAEDDRHLWPQMYRLIQEFKPSWVIGENVAGFINMALDDVCLDLENAGYEVQPFVIPACAADAPHRRDRVWIVAYSKKLLRNGGDHHTGIGTCTQPLSKLGNCRWSKVMAHPNSPLGKRNKRTLGGDQERAEYEQHSRWPTEPGVCRVAHGIPRRMDRLKGLGNAVVPQIPEIIGRAIMEIDRFCLSVRRPLGPRPAGAWGEARQSGPIGQGPRSFF